MKQCGKIAAAVLMALALPFGLAACGRAEADAEQTAFPSAAAYISENLPLPVENGSLHGCCMDGENLYFLATSGDSGNSDTDRTLLCRVSLERGETIELTDYRPADHADAAAMYSYGPKQTPDGSLWILDMWIEYEYSLPEDFQAAEDSKSNYISGHEMFYSLRQLDAETGGTLGTVDLTAAVRELDSETGVAWIVDGGGYIYLAAAGRVMALDRTGQPLFTLDAAIPQSFVEGSSGGPLVLLPDGTVAVLTETVEGGREVRTIDPAARTWGQTRYPLYDRTSLLYGGSGDYLFYYEAGDALYGWQSGTDEAQRLLSWTTAQLDSGRIRCCIPQADGRIEVLTQAVADGGSSTIQLLRLSPTDQTEDGRTILVYGTVNASSSIRYQVNQFDQSSQEYYIEIRDYYDGPADQWDAAAHAAAITRANVEILAGNIPDILDIQYFPAEIYAAQGIMEDLWPFIENDPELGRDALMAHVLECAEMDGKLYEISSDFTIYTAVGCYDVVGDRTSWTVDGLLEAFEAMPEGSTILGSGYTQQDLLFQLLSMTESRYVDWSTGTCRFDSEDFRALLELCGGQKYASGEYSSDGGAALREGRQLIEYAVLSRPSDLIYFDALCGGPEALMDYEGLLEAYGLRAGQVTVMQRQREDGSCAFADNAAFGTLRGSGYASYVGYPSEDGAGSAFWLTRPVAMSAASEHKDGVWAFLRELLLPGGYLYDTASSDGTAVSTFMGFPINRADFDRLMETCMEPHWFTDEDGSYILDGNGQRIEEAVLDELRYTLDIGYPVSMAVYQLALSQEQYDRFMELYNAIDRVRSPDSSIVEIAVEEAAAYFAGDKSLEETVGLIQNRAGLYLSENQ